MRWLAVSTLEFHMGGAYHGQRMRVGQAFAIKCAATLPDAIAADADIEDDVHFR